jgi:3-dehydroquinate dehydratase-1
MRLQAKRPVRVGERLLGGPDVLICVPLTSGSPRILIEEARALGALRPDCIEWRADALGDLAPADLPALLRSVAAAAGCPLLVTNRRPEEGGRAPQAEEHRIATLEAAAATGLPAMVDVELATPLALAERVATAARRAGVAVIRSWHDVAATPSHSTLLETLRAMQRAGADAAKVAVTPKTPEDVLVLLAAGLEARRSFLEIPGILMSMGPLGALTRLGGYFGNDLTFAVGLAASAPGQMALDLVRRSLAALGLREDRGTA